MSEEMEKVSWPGWRTVRLIGRGGFGRVYEIEKDILVGVEKAALKVISIPQNDSDIEEMYGDGHNDESITNVFKSRLKGIIAEYAMMRKLNDCINIVNCDDVRYVQHDDGIGWDVYIKMELLTPLTKALPQEIPEQTVVKIARDLCTALVLCRKHEIVHRDIKPQNIFVSPNGEYKLGDFGIAKTVEKTMGGTKIGTYKYMAPEVYNNQPYGSASDIYSLGLVLYWLLNERRLPLLPLPPVKLTAGMDEDARNRRLVGERFPAPKHGSKELKDIVMKACAYHVKDRYTSADEMLQDLNRLGRGDRSDETVIEAEEPTQMQSLTQAAAAPAIHDRKVPASAAFTKLEEETRTMALFSGSNDPVQERLAESVQPVYEKPESRPRTATQPLSGGNHPQRARPADEPPREAGAPLAEEGPDVHSEITIRTSQRTAGKQIPVDAAGKLVYIVLPGRVTDGQVIHYEGKGKRDPKTGKYGDLHLTVHVIEDSKKPAWLGGAIIAAAVLVVALCVGLLFLRNWGKKDSEGTMSGQNTQVSTQTGQNTQDEPQSGKETQTEPQSGKETQTDAQSGQNEQNHTHSWVDATCTSARYCNVCGQVSGEAPGHDWVDATCTSARYCNVCGQVSGEPLGHDWAEATYDVPQTCRVCGDTVGEPLRPEPKPLSEFTISAVVGKIWTRGDSPYSDSYHTKADAPECWKDWSKPGYTSGPVRDNMGNEYEHGIHIDGWDSGEYYYEIRLDGKYTTFSGVCACPEQSATIISFVYDTSRKCTKYFEVYGDGELLFTSATMRYDYSPQEFTIDVTGVQVLRILYPATTGPNETATIYDGLLS